MGRLQRKATRRSTLGRAGCDSSLPRLRSMHVYNEGLLPQDRTSGRHRLCIRLPPCYRDVELVDIVARYIVAVSSQVDPCPSSLRQVHRSSSASECVRPPCVVRSPRTEIAALHGHLDALAPGPLQCNSVGQAVSCRAPFLYISRYRRRRPRWYSLK